MERISISKYLNSIYNFYCNKSSINYKPIFENKRIINLNNDIIKILEKNYLLYPYVEKLLREILKYSISSNDFLREINFGTDFLP